MKYEKEFFTEENNTVWDTDHGYAEILTYKEKTYSLTKEQLISITDPQVKKWFPEVFETVLEVGKWYKKTWNDDDVDLFHVYDFNEDGSINDKGQYWRNGVYQYWKEPNLTSKDDRYVLSEVTESEVFEALKNEAVKRYKVGYYLKSLFNKKTVKICDKQYELAEEFEYNSYRNKLYFHGFTVFDNGQWAEIIPTITLEQAEKELGKKIIV